MGKTLSLEIDMNEKKKSWQRTFEAFAGPGIHRPSNMMRVTESEARTILANLADMQWQPPAYVGAGRHAGYIVCNATETWTTALFHHGDIVGVYAASSLWIARPHRGCGLSTPLILAAADHRGGSILPPGVIFQGYTPTGVLAHRSAHSHAVVTAVAAGQAVPAEVLDEMNRSDGRLYEPVDAKGL